MKRKNVGALQAAHYLADRLSGIECWLDELCWFLLDPRGPGLDPPTYKVLMEIVELVHPCLVDDWKKVRRVRGRIVSSMRLPSAPIDEPPKTKKTTTSKKRRASR